MSTFFGLFCEIFISLKFTNIFSWVFFKLLPWLFCLSHIDLQFLRHCFWYHEIKSRYFSIWKSKWPILRSLLRCSSHLHYNSVSFHHESSDHIKVEIFPNSQFYAIDFFPIFTPFPPYLNYSNITICLGFWQYNSTILVFRKHWLLLAPDISI